MVLKLFKFKVGDRVKFISQHAMVQEYERKIPTKVPPRTKIYTIIQVDKCDGYKIDFYERRWYWDDEDFCIAEVVSHMPSWF